MLPYPRTRAYDTNAAESFTDILILVMRPPPEVINVKVLDRRSASLSFFILPLSLSLSVPFRRAVSRQTNIKYESSRSIDGGV